MPVIYDAEMGRQWLRGPFGGRRMELDLVLQPLPSELLEAHEVSTNAPENDSPECIKPLPPGYVPRGQLPLLLKAGKT